MTAAALVVQLVVMNKKRRTNERMNEQVDEEKSYWLGRHGRGDRHTVTVVGWWVMRSYLMNGSTDRPYCGLTLDGKKERRRCKVQ